MMSCANMAKALWENKWGCGGIFRSTVVDLLQSSYRVPHRAKVGIWVKAELSSITPQQIAAIVGNNASARLSKIMWKAGRRPQQ